MVYNQECTGHIIPAKVVSITQDPLNFGRKLIHCTYDNGKGHADYPDRFRKKRNDMSCVVLDPQVLLQHVSSDRISKILK